MYALNRHATISSFLFDNIVCETGREGEINGKLGKGNVLEKG